MKLFLAYSILAILVSSCATSENIIVPDSTPPVILETSGSGNYPFGTLEVTILLVTEKPAECRLSHSSGHPFGALYTNFETVDGLTHSYQLSTYDPGTTVLFAQCRDLKNRVITPDEIPFTIDITTDVTARNED